jgi:hypothetical protein
MSIVGIKDGTMGVAFGVKNDGSFSIIPLCLESFVFQQMGLSYFEVIPKYKAIVHDLLKNKLKIFHISLPELVLTGIAPVGGIHFFTFINSDWE